jgi:alpha-glucosidase (family GH31 glycosyl hydrolase)
MGYVRDFLREGSFLTSLGPISTPPPPLPLHPFPPRAVWNLAPDPAHYNSIATVMRLRENLREYVSQINLETVNTGMPMMRPMFLAWPNDPNCQGPDVEDQYMFGPNWLVAPVYVYQATSRSVYLPALDANHTW